MKKILLITSHFPPSNLVGVHRIRLFALHFNKFNWSPIVLTVDEKYYEENLDEHIKKLIPDDLRIEKVDAWFMPSKTFRLVGDIGLRAFFPLLFKIIRLVKSEKIDFLYIALPSFYLALLGRLAHIFTGIKYGIDYIDPWVHQFPGSEKIFSRHWWSTQLAKILEPFAVKKASLITGVSEKYYSGVLERNPHLLRTSQLLAMPMGAEIGDHQIAKTLSIEPYIFPKKSPKFRFMYAGTMWTKAYAPLTQIFRAISENKEVFKDVEFHFVGTGSRANDAQSHTLKPIAEQFGLWQNIIFEYPQRFPYLDILIHLEAVDAVFIFGSTQAHYTPSKVFQAVMSEKPILAVLHTQSDATQVVRNTKAGLVLDFDGENGLVDIRRNFVATFLDFQAFEQQFSIEQVDKKAFEKYSAENITQLLAQKIDLLL